MSVLTDDVGAVRNAVDEGYEGSTVGGTAALLTVAEVVDFCAVRDRATALVDDHQVPAACALRDRLVGAVHFDVVAAIVAHPAVAASARATRLRVLVAPALDVDASVAEVCKRRSRVSRGVGCVAVMRRCTHTRTRCRC